MNIEQTGMSDSIKNLAVAQANIQKEIEDIAKDSEGYGYKYTSSDALVKHLGVRDNPTTPSAPRTPMKKSPPKGNRPGPPPTNKKRKPKRKKGKKK